jgi:fructose-1,6-bisphosphatase/inositol monophosphatase family enzyme
MSSIDIAAVQKIIAEVAAAEIMPRFRKLKQGDVEMKGVDDPVTVADKAAEEALIASLEGILPGSVFVGEESCAKDPCILSRFGGDDDVWVIDPIDGTRGFIEGRTEFGVLVALVQRRRTVAAWIHDPNTGDTLTAERGGGVWMRGKKMHLATEDSEDLQYGVIGSRVRTLLKTPEIAKVIAALPALTLGCAAAFDYARLFSGEGGVVFANSKAPRAAFLLYRAPSKPWDHVPGVFLHGEAGGYSADLSRHSYNIQDSKGGLLLASDIASWERLFDIIRPIAGALSAGDEPRS